jgi:hypothetical protein
MADAWHHHAMGMNASNGPVHSYSSVSIGNQSADHTHNFGNASPTGYNHLPKYISCVYIIKVL